LLVCLLTLGHPLLVLRLSLFHILFGFALGVFDVILSITHETLNLFDVALFEVSTFRLPMRGVDLIMNCIAHGRQRFTCLKELLSYVFDGHHVTTPTHKPIR
jgi:hypothetical protein